jgi:DNA-binding transcriptional ArsR family regulator
MLNQECLGNVFRALADPGRRAMVERLIRGPATVTELVKPLDTSLTAVIKHVQVLEASGLIRSREVGRTRTCSIDPAVLRSAEAWSSQRRAMVEQRVDRLADYLASTADPPDAGFAWLSLDDAGDESGENR